MKKSDMSPEKQKEFDDVFGQMMNEIEERLLSAPKIDIPHLDGPHTKIYQETFKKYEPRLREILRSAEIEEMNNG